MMTNVQENIVYVMRHGEDEFPGHLSQKGIGQVINAGMQIREELDGIDQVMIHHSPLRRAAHTAEVLAETLLPIRSMLREREELNSDTYNVGVVAHAVSGVGILVSHQPDIRKFLEQQGIDESVPNAYFRRFEF